MNSVYGLIYSCTDEDHFLVSACSRLILFKCGVRFSRRIFCVHHRSATEFALCPHLKDECEPSYGSVVRKLVEGFDGVPTRDGFRRSSASSQMHRRTPVPFGAMKGWNDLSSGPIGGEFAECVARMSCFPQAKFCVRLLLTG